MEIQGHPRHLIYPDGRVFSKIGKGRFLKTRIDYKGYETITIRQNNKTFNYKIHRLLAIHYIPNPENKPEVDHKNRIRDDNRLENLRWATPTEQCDNKKIQINNKTGHKHISITKSNNYFVRVKRKGNLYGNRTFRNKIDAICYKYILLLKIKSKYYY